MGDHYPQRPYHQGPRARQQNAYYSNGNGDPHSHAEYASGQRGHGGPVAPYQGMGGMVPFGQQYGNNPFAAHGPNGASFYDGQARYAMMPYGAPGFYGDPRQYSMPQHMQQYQMAPVPAATEHPGREVTPVPKEDIEKKRMADELAAIKAMQEEAKAAEKRKEDEARIKKEAEEAFKQRMEEARLYNERAAAEVAKARAEAERAARERIEAERKAQEEAAKQRADDMKRAEENARMKFEADQKAAEERRRKEDEDRKRAEEAARIRVEAAIKAEAEARAAAEKKVAEEAERIKKIEEDAKRKAEADAAAKVEKEKADAIAKAEAEAAAKKEQEELKEKWQEEARQKAENSAKQKADKAPIRFKDAVGRKFSFPFHLCQTWAGMEELIKQAFLQVDLLGPHVQEGHYDLTGPNGEIILPSVWEKVVEPDWSISMTMWPLDKSPPVGPGPRIPGPLGGHSGPMPPPRGVPVPGPPRRPRGEVPVTDGPRHADWPRPRSGPPRGVEIVNAAPKSRKHKKDDPILKFFTGSKPKKKSSKK
ncbi:putative kinetoplast-associated protein KAP [Emericellopsis atlantica]|uniref:Kinetoplast-associated protein KAP n=1 Tax=Emericellopsis atlantica TaxID=2614577 RepID=A0A9P7ZU41_9HYPO|nr:putative kinetoplast-associated protein KAP [Emericellopsis atlantica]KAG9258295.1 putative kinetoplast-associated protein KAP [Emericellopsis atlantica]